MTHAQTTTDDSRVFKHRVGAPVPSRLKLTLAQANMLRDGRTHCPGLQGRNEHGGGTHTMLSLLQRALLQPEEGQTPAGHPALPLADAPSTPSSHTSTQELLVDACSPRGET